MLPIPDDRVDPVRIVVGNNQTQQVMKQGAIGRNDPVLHGEIGPNCRAAGLLTFGRRALPRAFDGLACANDMLDRLLAGATDYHSLRPDVCKKSHPEAVRAR